MKLAMVTPGAWPGSELCCLYVDYLDSVNMATFVWSNLQFQAMKEADWQAS